MEIFEDFDTYRKRHHKRLIGEGKGEGKGVEASVLIKGDASIAIGLFYNDDLFYVLTKDGTIFFLIKASKKVAFVRGKSSIKEAWDFLKKNIISIFYFTSGTYNALEYPPPQDLINKYETLLEKYRYDIDPSVYESKKKFFEEEVMFKTKQKKYVVEEYGFTKERPSVDIMKLFYHPDFKDYAERDAERDAEQVGYFEKGLKAAEKEYNEEPELYEVRVRPEEKDGVKYYEKGYPTETYNRETGRDETNYGWMYKLIKGRVMIIGYNNKFYEEPEPANSSTIFLSYYGGKPLVILNRAQERQRQIEKETRAKRKELKE